jgi:NAD(P)-dependent dehydrogenase (short-subunit alcohol dehydrogenase family)
MFTRCLALDVAKFGIRVNAIGPGVSSPASRWPLRGTGDTNWNEQSRLPSSRRSHKDTQAFNLVEDRQERDLDLGHHPGRPPPLALL